MKPRPEHIVAKRVRDRLKKLESMPRRRYRGSVIWTWDQSNRVFRANTVDAELEVHFHKVGGRWSKGAGLSFWTFHVYFDRVAGGEHRQQFKTANEAKAAAEALAADLRRTRCPDCGGQYADHNAVNQTSAGLIAHSRDGGACWKSADSPFTTALADYLRARSS